MKDHAALLAFAESLDYADIESRTGLLKFFVTLGEQPLPDRRAVVVRLEQTEIADRPLKLDPATTKTIMEITGEIDRALVGRYLDAPLLS